MLFILFLSYLFMLLRSNPQIGSQVFSEFKNPYWFTRNIYFRSSFGWSTVLTLTYYSLFGMFFLLAWTSFATILVTSFPSLSGSTFCLTKAWVASCNSAADDVSTTLSQDNSFALPPMRTTTVVSVTDTIQDGLLVNGASLWFLSLSPLNYFCTKTSLPGSTVFFKDRNCLSKSSF